MMLRSHGRQIIASIRTTSSVSMRAFSEGTKPITNEYAKERSQYQSELSKLRKKWAEEHKTKLEERVAEERMERRKIVLQRALKLRERRQETARNLETQRILREEQLRKYKENLARTHILWSETQDKITRQRKAALNDLTSESKHWITKENKHLMITPELFARHPTTTGIVTYSSNYWRHEVFVPSLHRLLSDHFVDSVRKSSEEDTLRRQQGQARVAKRAAVETFLNDIIDNPEDRAQFKTLVARTTRQLEVTGAFDDLDEAFDDTDEFGLENEDFESVAIQPVSEEEEWSEEDISKLINEMAASGELEELKARLLAESESEEDENDEEEEEVESDKSSVAESEIEEKEEAVAPPSSNNYRKK